MPDAVAELAERGRALGARDRERLVDLTIDSSTDAPDADVEEAWRLEVRRRVQANESGEAVLHNAANVMAEAERLAP